MIRCNNCMRLYESELELDSLTIQEGFMEFETILACPNCRTDVYLTDLEQEEQ